MLPPDGCKNSLIIVNKKIELIKSKKMFAINTPDFRLKKEYFFIFAILICFNGNALMTGGCGGFV